ncbi:MAG: diguanylate cyclase [bacterium]
MALILYAILPLWGVMGFADYLCHRASHIEDTTGIRETFMHLGMGIQVGIPIFLALFFWVDITVMLIAFVVFVTHEIVAHMDVAYAYSRRPITIWEQQAHAYMCTIPFYLLSLLVVLNWGVFQNLIHGNWAGHMALTLRPEPAGGLGYVKTYLIFMGVLAYGPYMEELWRCWRALQRRKALA